ncbi:MAG TPA: hypothetical protein VGB50_12000 [Flavobacterium sp.]|jgi:hypothetical protein
MRNFLLISILSLSFFQSCQYIDKRVPSEEVLLEKELNSIDWKQVDEFPSISNCEEIHNKDLRRQCFFEYLTQEIQLRLNIDTFSTLYPELDTIEVRVTVYPDSTLRFEPQFIKDSVAYDKIKIDSILRTRLADFPKVSPAIKRGIPVRSQFVLPVILKME